VFFVIQPVAKGEKTVKAVESIEKRLLVEYNYHRGNSGDRAFSKIGFAFIKCIVQ
jgi:hypothetical protein